MSECKKCGIPYSYAPLFPDGEYCPTCLILRNANKPLNILLGQKLSMTSEREGDGG